MLVRPACEEDAAAIAEVFVASFRRLTFLPLVHEDDEIRTWIRAEVVPEHEVWVAETAGEIAAFAALKGDLLGHLYVRPDAPRRRIGSSLLELVRREPDALYEWVP